MTRTTERLEILWITIVMVTIFMMDGEILIRPAILTVFIPKFLIPLFALASLPTPISFATPP